MKAGDENQDAQVDKYTRQNEMFLTKLTENTYFVRICTDKIAQSTYRFFQVNFVYLDVYTTSCHFSWKITGKSSVLEDGVFSVFYCLKIRQMSMYDKLSLCFL